MESNARGLVKIREKELSDNVVVARKKHTEGGESLEKDVRNYL